MNSIDKTNSEIFFENFPKSKMNSDSINNAEMLCTHIWLPLTDHFDYVYINITSGYRTVEQNHKVGGVATSQHLTGKAIDFSTYVVGLNKDLFNWIKDNLEFDQLIEYFNYKFIHVSYNHKKNRKQILHLSK